MIPKIRVWDELGERMVYNAGFTPEGIAYTIPKGAEDSDQFDYYPECPVMQDTGLKDKNGKKIYEGDIVNVSYFEDKPQYEKVGFYITKSGDYAGLNPFTHSPDGYPANYCKVVGNIYENPELLK